MAFHPGSAATKLSPMRQAGRPHILGIDDGPFDKSASREVVVVGVMMEGSDLVESVVVTSFPVDGPEATPFLADWVSGLRLRPALQGVVLGGITLAGLAVVDMTLLSERLGLPVLVVNRRDPTNHRLHEALAAAGLEDRSGIVERTPPAFEVETGLFLSHAGIERAQAVSLVRATLSKSALPEPLRLAHLIARAMATGESRGRV